VVLNVAHYSVRFIVDGGPDGSCRPPNPNGSLADSQSALPSFGLCVRTTGEDSGCGLASQPFSPIPLPPLVPSEPADPSTLPPSEGGLREVCL
jgi:hypothetical protein